jgi:hypothetical protein
MYIYFFERIVRALSRSAGFALPYWNYFPEARRALPRPFRSPADVNSNALYVQQRSGSINAGNPIPASAVDHRPAFGYTNFTDGSLSFGGPRVAFTSRSDNLVSPSYGPDRLHAYVRTLRDDCRAPAGPAGPGGPAARDTTPPVIGRARMSRKRFTLGKRRTVRAARGEPARGTKFVFSLSEDARTRIAIARKRTRIVLTRSRTKRGVNRVAFSGRIGRRKLKPGVYRATLVATDAAGNRSKPKRLTFRVVRR